MRMIEPDRMDAARARLTREAVAYAFGIEPEDIDQPTRGASHIALARQVAMYLAHISFELSLSRVALAFRRDRTTASHACHVVEDRRDDPDFDARLDRLEAFLRSAPLPTEISGCRN
ncbi:MAG: chromosomal replication initiator DnaA [Maricaulis sp.]|nr:chromosomal replication initiator DnaA [Maricaulis sp.]